MPDRQAPPTISVVDPIDYSGMAYYTAGLADGLAEAGASVIVMGSDKPLVGPKSDDQWRSRPVFSGTGPGRARWRRAAAYPLATRRLLRQIRRDVPDWILWNYIEQPALDRFAIRTVKRRGVHVAFIAHETEPWESSTSRRATYRWLIEEAADAVVVHGSANARALQGAWNIADERVIVSEHGDYRAWVDASADQGAARGRLGLPADPPMALFFGTLRMSKGLRALLEAWPEVRRTVPQAELVIAGRPYRGTDSAVLGQSQAGVTMRIGEISSADAADYYAASDVVAIPYDRVSTSGVLRYAYSAGRPVVATDIGELHDHVQEGTTGRLVPPGDQARLASAVADMLRDRDGSSAMGKKALAYCQATFDWHRIGAQLLQALTTVRVRA